MAKIQFKFEGDVYEVNGDQLNDYKTLKAIAKAKQEPAYMFTILETIFDGRDEEYADRLGGSMEKMGELIAAAIEAVGAKNS